MTPEEVAASYDAIAERWDGPGFPRHNGIAPHRRAIAFTERRGPALDIGCGSSGRIIDLLLEEGFVPEGLDLSERMLERARRRHPQVVFHHADICQWDPPRRYDFISAWDSLWHIPLPAHESVMAKVLGALAPAGVMIVTTGGVDAPDERRDAAMGPPMYHSAPGLPAMLAILARAGCVCRHLEYDQFPENHVYLIAQRLG